MLTLITGLASSIFSFVKKIKLLKKLKKQREELAKELLELRITFSKLQNQVLNTGQALATVESHADKGDDIYDALSEQRRRIRAGSDLVEVEIKDALRKLHIGPVGDLVKESIGTLPDDDVKKDHLQNAKSVLGQVFEAIGSANKKEELLAEVEGAIEQCITIESSRAAYFTELAADLQGTA